jgi:hypothetical protein
VRGYGSQYKLVVPGDPERGPTILRMFLSSSVVLLFVDLQINPFISSPSDPASERQSFRFSAKVFSATPLLEGREKSSHRGPNVLSAALNKHLIENYQKCVYQFN